MSSVPIRRGAARHEELADGVMRLVLDEGFSHLTLDDVAGRLRCSKRTLYTLARTREHLLRSIVVRFFRIATERVNSAIEGVQDPADRIEAYLNAIAAELSCASPAFFEDVSRYGPAAEVYAWNTRAAAARIETMIDEGMRLGAFREVNARFVADLITAQMVRIQGRAVAAATGLSDSQAYAELAMFATAGLGRPRNEP